MNQASLFILNTTLLFIINPDSDKDLITDVIYGRYRYQIGNWRYFKVTCILLPVRKQAFQLNPWLRH